MTLPPTNSGPSPSNPAPPSVQALLDAQLAAFNSALQDALTTQAASFQALLNAQAASFESLLEEKQDATGVKVYRALLSQSGTNDPTAVVLEDSIGSGAGTIVWTRTGSGTYLGTLTGAFPSGRVWLGVRTFNTSLATASIRLLYFTADAVSVFTQASGSFGDNNLANTPIEILVYP